MSPAFVRADRVRGFHNVLVRDGATMDDERFTSPGRGVAVTCFKRSRAMFVYFVVVLRVSWNSVKAPMSLTRLTHLCIFNVRE